MNVQDQLRAYVTSNFVYEPNHKALDADDDLLNQGVVDSMGILQIVTHLEETFGIRVEDEDITPDNFRTIRAMSDFVMQKSAAKQVA